MKLTGEQQKIFSGLAWVATAIIAFVPFHAFFTSWAGNNFNHLDAIRLWKESLLLIALPFVLYLVWKMKLYYIWRSAIVRLFLAYIFLHMALGFWALHAHKVNNVALLYALIINLRFIYFFIFCYVIASYSPWLKEKAPRLIIVPTATVILGGLIQKLAFPRNLLGYFYGHTILAYQTVDSNEHLKRVQSTLRGANPLGAYLILGITAILAFVKGRFLRAVLLTTGGVVLIYSYSRSAWVGAIISLWLLSWWTLLKRHHRIWLVSSILGLVLVLGGVFYVYKSRSLAQDAIFHTSSDSHSPVTSNEARSLALRNGLNDVINDPLGGGPGTAGPASFRNTPHPSRISENYFLQIAQEVGILGLAIFIAINVLVARELWSKKDDLLAKVLLASLAGITFVNLVSHAWADDTLAYVWWGLAGICLAPAIISSRNKPKNAKTHQKTA